MSWYQAIERSASATRSVTGPTCVAAGNKPAAFALTGVICWFIFNTSASRARIARGQLCKAV